MGQKILRVLHILGELRPSGAETMLAVGAPCFAEHGVKGDVLSTGSKPGTFAEQLAGVGYNVHHLAFSRSPRFFLRLFQRMRGRYDVIHIHMERASFWVGLVALCSGAAVVRTVHSSFSFAGLLRLRRGLQRRLLQAFGVRFVAVGQSVRENEAAKFGVRAELIENWCDTSRFRAPDEPQRRLARERLGLYDDVSAIVSVGNCGIAKNHGALIAALALLPARVRVVYLHVGEEEPERSERTQAEALGVSDRVRFLGRLNDVRPILQAGDVFVMPSLYEGFSIAAVEALATGLPAVLADVPGLTDCRLHFDGITYADPEPHSLAEALMTVLALTMHERRTIAQHYPDVARRWYSPRRGVEGYVRLYTERLGTSVGGSERGAPPMGPEIGTGHE